MINFQYIIHLITSKNIQIYINLMKTITSLTVLFILALSTVLAEDVVFTSDSSSEV